jgi:hypothetical protein
MRRTVLAVLVAMVFSGCTDQAHSDKQIRFEVDVKDHGGLSVSDVYNGETTLGDAVCGDLHKGQDAASSVMGVANDAFHGSIPKAEVVVY